MFSVWFSPLKTAAKLVTFALIASGLACSSGSSPTEPSAPPSASASLTGTWSGSASDSSGPGQMTWQITQSGTSVSGTMTMTDTSTKVTGRGTISGTVSGSSLQFTVSVLAGGFDNPYNACSANVAGNATISTSSLSGTYDGSSSCSGAITSGQLTLNKQ